MLVSLVLFMCFFLPTPSTIEINVSDVSMFKLTNIFAGQDYTSKQRKTDDFLFYNRSDLRRFHFHVNLVAGLSRKRCLGRKFLPGKILYYSNSVATYNILLLRAGDVERNPGDKLKCPACQRTIAMNHCSIRCSICSCTYHIKCGDLSIKQYRASNASTGLLKPWMCNYCCLAILPFSTTSTEELISLFSESALPDIDSSACDSQSLQSPIEWFSTTINGYYKNNFKIGHLNVNSILGKADEVINLLDECAFDILFITESKIDGTTSSSLFTHSQYCIIRRGRKRGGGGLLVYIRSNVTAHRQINLEPEGVESICLDVKGYANNWFLICACYRSPGKCKITDFIPACATAAERMYVKRKEIMFIGDFNMNMLESPDNPNGPNKDLTNFMEQFCLTNVIHEAKRTTNCSSTLLDIILTSHPERLATSGILQVGISDHDLIFVVKKQKLPRPKATTIDFRSIKNLDQNAFLSDLKNVPWNSSYIFKTSTIYGLIGPAYPNKSSKNMYP